MHTSAQHRWVGGDCSLMPGEILPLYLFSLVPFSSGSNTCSRGFCSKEKLLAREDRCSAAVLVVAVRAAMCPLLMHRLKRQISGCFTLRSLQEGTRNSSCSLENRESHSGGKVWKSLLPDALWPSYTPHFGNLEIKQLTSWCNLLVSFAGRIIPWAGANWHSLLALGRG